jgi:hypothetical protein
MSQRLPRESAGRWACRWRRGARSLEFPSVVGARPAPVPVVEARSAPVPDWRKSVYVGLPLRCRVGRGSRTFEADVSRGERVTDVL